jgi:alanine dehydrogenase
LSSAAEVWRIGDLILKVKEPIASEYHLLRPGQTLSPTCT